MDEARQDTRYLDDGDFVFTAKGIAPAQPDDEVQRLVGDLRKRVRRIQPDRNQQRPHGAFKIRLDPAPLHRIALAMRHDTDALLRKRWQQFLVVQRILAGHHVVRQTGQRLERLRCANAFLHMVLSGCQVRGGTDFKKFVQVGRHDA